MYVILTVQAENDKMLKICTDKASNYHQICLYLSLTNRHTYTLFSVARRLSQTITEQYKLQRHLWKEHIQGTHPSYTLKTKQTDKQKNAPKCNHSTDTGKRHVLH